ncbi:MAG: DNA/RNA non-specific endonuclease [Planctomycetota bacterium]
METLTNTGYVVGYDNTRKDPAWVAFCHRTASSQHIPRPEKFMVDNRTTAKVASENYTRSGYDRGHMAPNYAIGICFGPKAQMETFLMSNICPQKPDCNRKTWKRLEEKVVEYGRRFQEVWEITGPVFGSHPGRLRGGVEIPEAFYKILLNEDGGKIRVMAFVVPQSVTGTEPLERFLTRVDKTEKETGLDFFWELPDEVENVLEATNPGRVW